MAGFSIRNSIVGLIFITNIRSILSGTRLIYKGAAKQVEDFSLLLPGDYLKNGIIISEKKLHSNDLEIAYSFSFNALGTEGEGFALWLSLKDLINVQLDDELKEESIYGIPKEYGDIVVLFAIYDRIGHPNASVSLFQKQRSDDRISDALVPTKNGIFFNFNVGEIVNFKLTISNSKIKGQIKYSTANRWYTSFTETLVKSGLYSIGLSSKNTKTVRNEIMISNLSISGNHEIDKSEFPVADDKISHHTDNEMGKAEYNFLTLHNEVQTLSKTLNQRDIILNNRLEQIQSAINDIYKTLRSNNQSGSKGPTIEHVHNEISTIRDLVKKHSLENEKVLHTVKTKLNDHHNEHEHFNKNNNNLYDAVKYRNTISIYFSFTIFLCILILGIYIWKRFKDMEKKHLL